MFHVSHWLNYPSKLACRKAGVEYLKFNVVTSYAPPAFMTKYVEDCGGSSLGHSLSIRGLAVLIAP